MVTHVAPPHFDLETASGLVFKAHRLCVSHKAKLESNNEEEKGRHLARASCLSDEDRGVVADAGPPDLDLDTASKSARRALLSPNKIPTGVGPGRG